MIDCIINECQSTVSDQCSNTIPCKFHLSLCEHVCVAMFMWICLFDCWCSYVYGAMYVSVFMWLCLCMCLWGYVYEVILIMPCSWFHVYVAMFMGICLLYFVYDAMFMSVFMWLCLCTCLWGYVYRDMFIILCLWCNVYVCVYRSRGRLQVQQMREKVNYSLIRMWARRTLPAMISHLSFSSLVLM